MRNAKDELQAQGEAARRAARLLANVPAPSRDRALTLIADGLKARQEEVLAANEKDVQAGQRNGLGDAALGRLLLDPPRLEVLAENVRTVAAMADPVSESFDARSLPNGLRVARRRVPIGVIGVIYESRPNVTIDIAALCVKSGNAVVLRGGSEAYNSNLALATLVRDSLSAAELPAEAVQFVGSTDRDLVGYMLGMKNEIDLLIPRGSADLVRRVAAEATMPAITGGIGVCHTFVDKAADVEMAVSITHNAKVSSPYVCNALDTVIVHSEIAPNFLPRLATYWSDVGVNMHCDRRALSILGQRDGSNAQAATDEDWGREFLSLTAAVKVVDSLDEAMEHIEKYGSGHTEAIVTEDYAAATRFLDEVDSGVLLVNASTRFNDGGQLGLGAEVAISTGKMHARGPLGLRELTSYKWTVQGTGQIRE